MERRLAELIWGSNGQEGKRERWIGRERQDGGADGEREREGDREGERRRRRHEEAGLDNRMAGFCMGNAVNGGARKVRLRRWKRSFRMGNG